MAAMVVAGWMQVGFGQNSSYQIIKGKFTWDEAKSDAENRGGYLAVITSQQEQNVINQIVKSASTYLWLGGTSTGGEWKWITGENWNYTNWSFNEPSNDGAYLSIWANESVTNRDLGTWNDSYIQPSTYRNGYLLEIVVRPDTDNDGLLDHVEIEIGTDITKADTDDDGLSDYEEYITYKTSPISADSDGDGLPDGIEIAEGFDPLVGTEASDGKLTIRTALTTITAVELEFFTLKSQSYQLQWSTDLSNWNNNGFPFKGVGGFLSIHRFAREDGEYWRLKVVE